MTPQEFANKIRAKFPNGVAADGRSYTAISDDELTHKIIEKYPVYASQVKAPDTRDFLQKASDAVKASPLGFTAPLGEAVGTSIHAIGQALHGDFAGAAQTGQANKQNYSKIVGSTVASATLPVSMAIGGGTGASVAARIGSAALKTGASSALLGGGEALSQGSSVTDALKTGAVSGVTGAVLGGGAQGAGELASYLTKNLPNRLVKRALPKLEKGTEDFAMKNTKIGSIESLLHDSNSSVSNLGEQVQTVLKHPEYANDLGAGNFAVQKTLNAFPNSGYTAPQILSTIKKLVPAQATLVDKVAKGSATLLEKNTLRASIDPIIKKVFTDAPQVTASKSIGAEFANALRGEVQAHAPETQTLFANLSKEINLRNALKAAAKKLDTKSALGLYDITAGLAGFATGGPVGTGIAIASEKALRSPAVGLAAAKGLSKLGPALAGTGKAAQGFIPQASAAIAQKIAPASPPQSQSTKPISSPNPTTPSINDKFTPEMKQRVRDQINALVEAGPIGGVTVARSVGGVAKNVLTHIHADDLQTMKRFINAARQNLPTSLSFEKSVQGLAEHWGLNVNKSAKSLANAFEDILRGKTKVKSTIQQARDQIGRYTK